MTSKRGFTLIELSIVLVIIGLIVGGVLVGRDLIQAAKLRSVLTDIGRFNTAALAFKEKYGCIPGDCKNATDYLGTIPGGCASDNGSTIMSSGTCNGDGNGQIVLWAPVNWMHYDETTLFWQQLSLTHLIQGNYTGMLNWTGGMGPGVNVPVSSLEQGCFAINYSSSNPNQTYLPITPMNANVFTLGNPSAFDGNGPLYDSCTAGLYSLSAASARALDSKIDDGMPFSGTVQTTLSLYGGNYNWSGNSPPGCTNENGSPPIASAIYDASVAVTACQLLFKASF